MFNIPWIFIPGYTCELLVVLDKDCASLGSLQYAPEDVKGSDPEIFISYSKVLVMLGGGGAQPSHPVSPCSQNPC
jgi:hypothetical protein